MQNVTLSDLAGKVAVVTGANGGIGLATVEALTAQGVHVVMTDLHAPDALPENTEFRKLDVTDVDALRALAADVAATRGSLDIWVNNAGFLKRQDALDLELSDWQKTLTINLQGTFFGAQAAARQMAKQGSGAIINLSSYAGIKTRPNCPDYASAKAGVAHLTQCLALEWGPLGIRVNAIAPGFIETPMSSWMHGNPEVYQAYLAKIPAGRLGQPEEIGKTVAYLASDLASYVTGHVIAVDGGASKA
ncbi:SDR family oxidoreductase [Pseudochrobactrum sp. sp1633]|uniref:SDR family NAD(P)-dependent oxidoreductase n=1 Tax=Pseudochrobactrum sp. sp1633 TaxID=3036706 RepID=UPI0025A4D7DC|nr:SDR family oxidoreductase [Pseudochrobactrum sp. sp1633]MDM8345883.1 SDR family oxidoreductase [Pseudochrobactrum sp. sp1633]HWD12260.1 SDR family oxidoreductase [Pseudochrobactrum sp.]